MATLVQSPVLVREDHSGGLGAHSYNAGRRTRAQKSRRSWVAAVRSVLLVAGLCGIGYYGYTVADEYVYQAYENWAFDQQIAGHLPVTFADWVRDKTPFSFLVGARTNQPTAPIAQTNGTAPKLGLPPAPVAGELLGRVEIPRLNLSAVVREGVDAGTLSRAVGHVPSTALPGQSGNFAIAAHRDTLFRALKDIHEGDQVEFESANGTYSYQVFSTKIVKPSDVSVLRPDGGLSNRDTVSTTTTPDNRFLTMITCYPFYYVGSAPNRFIVQAKLISSTGIPSAEARDGPAQPPPRVEPRVKTRVHQASTTKPRPRRGFSYVRASSNSAQKTKNQHKRGFWHKLLHPY